MKRVRVIPLILIENGRAVITVKFKRRIYVGDPINVIKIFNDKEVDELIILDITDKKLRNRPDFDLISQMASESFMPLAYGGFLNTVNDVDRVIRSGIEKVSFNTALFENPELVKSVVDRWGRQSVVGSLDVSRNFFGDFSVRLKSSKSGIDSAISHVADTGIGELLLTAADRDGTMSGYDLELIRRVSSRLDIPLVAAGGARTIHDFYQAVEAGASAVAAGAMFCFKGSYNSVLINYPEQQTLHDEVFNRVNLNRL